MYSISLPKSNVVQEFLRRREKFGPGEHVGSCGQEVVLCRCRQKLVALVTIVRAMLDYVLDCLDFVASMPAFVGGSFSDLE